MVVHKVRLPSLRKKKPEDGLIVSVAKNLNENSKTVHAAVKSTKMLATTSVKDVISSTSASVPVVLDTIVVKPSKLVGYHLSFYLDYIIVSCLSILTAYYLIY